MRRRLVLAIVISTCLASTSAAQLPDLSHALVDHYRFLPRVSVIDQTGGIIGGVTNWRVVGNFDFHIEPGPTDVYPSHDIAKFQNVDAWGIQPNRNYAVNLNQALNLEGITGYKVDAPAPGPLFQFQGTTGDGSTVKLDALLRGPWLYLRGKTTPPVGGADYFEYTIHAVARQAPFADVNDDGVVDRLDLASISGKLGRSLSGADFLAWQQQVGEVQPTIAEFDAALDAAMAGASGPASSLVPEPGTLCLAALGVAALAVASRSRSLRIR